MVGEPGGGEGAIPFLPVEGEGLHQIPVGPVHAGIIEPGHFRFTCNGEAVVRLEERLGYVHKGIEALLAGADLERAARIISHVSGDSTVAYQIAFARAVGPPTGGEPPRRAVWLQALMAELERIANHVNDVGFIANDAAFALLHAHCGILREQVLQACDAVFGHRLMMDRIVPGAWRSTWRPRRRPAAAPRGRAEGPVRRDRLGLRRKSLLKDRTVGTGIVSGQLARFAAGSHVQQGLGPLLRLPARPGLPP